MPGFAPVLRLAVTHAAILAANLAWAGPPFRTDDPEVGASRQLEFILFFEQALLADGRDGVQPGVELNYGASENIQLHMLTPVAFTVPTGEANHSWLWRY
jgi:hypothetical protein